MKKKSNELIFISRIERDGSGVIIITPDQQEILEHQKYVDETFNINVLSLTEKTYIACGFNSYVVKLK